MSRRQFGGYPPLSAKKQAAAAPAGSSPKVPSPSPTTPKSPVSGSVATGPTNPPTRTIPRPPPPTSSSTNSLANNTKSPFLKTTSSPVVVSSPPKAAASPPKVSSSPPANTFTRTVSTAPKSTAPVNVVRPASAGAAPTSKISSPAAITKPLTGTTLIVTEPALGQLNSTYGFAKDSSTTTEEKLKFILSSTDDRVSNNAMVIGTQILEAGQGINFFVNLLLASEEQVVRNVCNLLTNFAQQPAVISAITQVGFTQLLLTMRNSKDKLPFVRLLCNCMNNEKTCIAYIKQGGLIAVLDILSGSGHSFEVTTAALMILSNSVATVKDNTFVFAEENTLRALLTALKSRIDPEAQAIVVRILVNVTMDDVNRTLFVKLGIMPEVQRLLATPEATSDAKLNQMLVRLVGNLLKGTISSKHAVSSGAMEFLAKSLQSTDSEVVLPALASLANFALNDKIISESCEKIVSSGIFTQLNRIVGTTSRLSHEVRTRAAITMSNLMTIDALQKPFDQSGGTASLIAVASSHSEDEEIRLKALGGLFHLSMYSDAIRSQIVAKGGLKVLTDALALPGSKQEMRSAAAKALVNLSLNDDTEDQFVTSGAIKPLVTALQDTKTGTEFQTLASMCLENLSYNNAASDAIREAGGIDVALKYLGESSSSPAVQTMQERSVKLLSKLAINGRNRKLFQDKGGAELVKKVIARSTSAETKQIATVALNNMSVPHFEDVYSSIGRGNDSGSDTASTSSSATAEDNFDELKGYGLGDEDEGDFGSSNYDIYHSYRPEDEVAPEMPVSDDEIEPEVEIEDTDQGDNGFDPAPHLEEEDEDVSDVIIHHDVEQPPPPAPVKRAFNRVNTLPYRPQPPPSRSPSFQQHTEPQGSSSSTDPAPEAPPAHSGTPDLEEEIVYEEEEEEEDRGLKKEAYMLAEDPSNPAAKKTSTKSKFSLFISRIKERITGTETNEAEEAAAAALPSGPWKVQEDRVTNRCAAIIFDWFDYWCDSCKKNGSTCEKEFDELRSLRMTLIKERRPKSYKAGTKAIQAEPFLATSPRSNVRFAAEVYSPGGSSSSSESPPQEAPPTPPVAAAPKLSASVPAVVSPRVAAANTPPPALPPKPERYRGISLTTDDVKSVNPTLPGSITPTSTSPSVGMVRATSAPLPKPVIQAATTVPARPVTIAPVSKPAIVAASPKKVAPAPRPAKTAAAATRKVVSYKELPPDADPARIAAAKVHFKRTRIVQELLETEGSYVKSLAVMVKKFQNPLLNMATSPKPLASEVDVRTMFSSIEIIFSINSMLLEGLNAKMRRWSTKQTIGDVFLFMGDFLKTYTDYINHYDTSQTCVLRCMQENPRFMRFLEDMAADPVCKGLGLPSLLVMPVQRVPRYSLLLRELIKSTPQDHPDHKNIVGACDKVDKVAAYLNEKRKEFDARLKLGEIAYSLLGEIREIVQPHREFVAEFPTNWELINQNQSGKSTGKGKLFLFNDALLVCKQSSKSKQKMKKLMFLNTITSSMATPGGMGWQAQIGNGGERLCIFFATPAEQVSFIEKFHNLTDPARASRMIR